MPSLQKALRILHRKYQVPNVVISSIPLKPWLLTALPSSISLSNEVDGRDENSDRLLCLSSSIIAIDGMTIPTNTHVNGSKSIEYSSIVHAACVPLIPGYFSGVGDLFSALVLSHFHPGTSVPLNSISKSQSTQPPSKPTHIQTTLSYAASLALTKTHAILSKTHEYSLSLPEEERLPSDDELDTKDPMRKIKRMRGRELAIIQNQDIIRGVGLNTVNTRWMCKWDSFWES
jgi:pyridoxine kinase